MECTIFVDQRRELFMNLNNFTINMDLLLNSTVNLSVDENIFVVSSVHHFIISSNRF